MGKLKLAPAIGRVRNRPRLVRTVTRGLSLGLSSSNRLLRCGDDGLSRDAEVLVERRGRA